MEKKDGLDGFRVNWFSIEGYGCLMKSRTLSIGTGNRISSAHIGIPITVERAGAVKCIFDCRDAY